MLIVREAVHVWGRWDIREISESPSQLCCEPETTLKKKVYFLKGRNEGRKGGRKEDTAGEVR